MTTLFLGELNPFCTPNTSFDSLSLDGCLLSAVQPNKVYIGGLPEHTRQEDLQNCFGKLGDIVNIELKYVWSSFCCSSHSYCLQSWLWLCGMLMTPHSVSF